MWILAIIALLIAIWPKYVVVILLFSAILTPELILLDIIVEVIRHISQDLH